VYIFPVYTVYIHFSTIYLFIMQQECNILKTIVCGMVNSQQLVVVSLQKHFSSRYSTVFNSISIVTKYGTQSGTVRSECATNRLGVRFQMVSLHFFFDII